MAVSGVGVTDVQTLLSAGGNQSMVQLAGAGGGDTASVHAAAAEGIKGGGGALPHGDKIQQAFGHHDVSSVKAHTGAQAAQANTAMGAEAYATGNNIAFKGAPDLHTAAHEAAHVVQQRGGVSLSGGVGKVGDGYERHADAVADKVVKGESAQGLLDQMSGGAKGGGVQKKAVQKVTTPSGPSSSSGGSSGSTPPSGGTGRSAAPTSGSGATTTTSSSSSSSSTTRSTGGTTSTTTSSSSASSSGAPPARTRPTTDSDYMALAGWGQFNANVTRFGIGDQALPAWKKAMDQLYTNEETYERIKTDPVAMLNWVDSDPARVGFNEMGQLLLSRHPLDTSQKYALWSGKPSEEYANTQGYQVLESTVLGELFNNVRLVFTEWNVMKTLWRAISNIYANEIGKIMTGQKIHVFHRKEGEIFQQVESKALDELAKSTRIPPQYEFHPMVVPGMFGHDSTYEPSPTNPEWRKNLTDAAGGDVTQAKAAAEAEAVRIFDHSATVPVAALVDRGPKTSESASNAVNAAHNATVLAGCQRAKRALESAAATSTTAGATPARPGRI